MSWHYQARKRVDKGQDYFDVVERYETPDGWTKDGMTPSGETLEELTQDLERMLTDVTRFPVLEDNEP